MAEFKANDLNAWTLMAIGVTVFLIANVLHEAVGHGGSCLLAGGILKSISTAYADCDCETITAQRIVSASGTLVNLASGFLGLLFLRKTNPESPRLRYFWWLFFTVNLLVATGYPLFSGVMNVGDWITVVRDLQPAWLWRVILILSGLFLYLFAVWAPLRELSLLIGEEEPQRRQRAFRMSLLPYLAGSFFSTVGAALNPISPLFILTSGAAHFGGASGLAWMTQFLKRPRSLRLPVVADPPLPVQFSAAWISAALILLFLHVTLLGPSLQFHSLPFYSGAIQR